MSANNNKKCFCKVCHDAGKSEAEYTSHYVKSNDGKVVCPFLLSQKCRFCDKPGHTTSYCLDLKKYKKAQEKAQKQVAYQEQQKQKEKPNKVSNQKNAFNLLCVDSDDEKDTEEVAEEVFAAPSTTWASIASLPAKPQPAKQVEVSVAVMEEPEPEEMKKPIYPYFKKYRSWADETSSDEEYYEDDE